MKVSDAVKKVSRGFVYKSDKRFILDLWFVMRDKGGRLEGDCDDFTITCLWECCDRRLSVFLWKVMILHQYRVHWVKSATGYHVVGEVDGLWFDNWTKRALPKGEFFATTKHKHKMQYLSPMMAIYLVCGLFVR